MECEQREKAELLLCCDFWAFLSLLTFWNCIFGWIVDANGIHTKATHTHTTFPIIAAMPTQMPHQLNKIWWMKTYFALCTGLGCRELFVRYLVAYWKEWWSFCCCCCWSCCASTKHQTKPFYFFASMWSLLFQFYFFCSSLCCAPNFAFFRLISFWGNYNLMLMHHVGSLTLFDCYCLKYQIMSVAEHSLHRANCEEKAADTQHRTSNEILSSPRLMCLNYVSGISSFCSSLTKHTHEYVLILHTNRPDPNRPRASIQWIYAQLFFIIISFVFWKEIP